MMNDYCMCQEVDQPTRENDKLDLIFTNNDELMQRTTVEKTTLSDHDIVIAETNIKGSEISDTPGRTRRSNRIGFEDLNFWSSKIEWNQIKKEVAAIDWFRGIAENQPNVEEI